MTDNNYCSLLLSTETREPYAEESTLLPATSLRFRVFRSRVTSAILECRRFSSCHSMTRLIGNAFFSLTFNQLRAILLVSRVRHRRLVDSDRKDTSRADPGLAAQSFPAPEIGNDSAKISLRPNHQLAHRPMPVPGVDRAFGFRFSPRLTLRIHFPTDFHAESIARIDLFFNYSYESLNRGVGHRPLTEYLI